MSPSSTTRCDDVALTNAGSTRILPVRYSPVTAPGRLAELNTAPANDGSRRRPDRMHACFGSAAVPADPSAAVAAWGAAGRKASTAAETGRIGPSRAPGGPGP